MTGVVFDAATEANFSEHFKVVFGSHFDALGFDEAVLFFEVGDLFDLFLVDGFKGGVDFVLRHDEVTGG